MDESTPAPAKPQKESKIDLNKINILSDEELPQFDDILADPNGVAYVREVLHQTRLHQNVLTLNEFHTYAPLFRYSGKDELGNDEYGRLSLEYATRICRFDPVYVVDDDKNILFVLPPVFNRTNTINVLGETGTNIAQAFVNACQLPDEIASGKREKYGQYYRELFSLAQNETEHERHKAVAAAMAADVLTKTKQATEQAKQHAEVEDLNPAELKDNVTEPSSAQANDTGFNNEDEDISYM